MTCNTKHIKSLSENW